MTLLDRFRTSPRHKHPDPTVRLAFVAEIPVDDREAIGVMARDDEDARVRKAAVSKLMDVGALVRSSQQDPDEGVRTQATTMLRDIALESFEDLGETEGLEAVDGLADAMVPWYDKRTPILDGFVIKMNQQAQQGLGPKS